MASKRQGGQTAGKGKRCTAAEGEKRGGKTVIAKVQGCCDFQQLDGYAWDPFAGRGA